MFFVLSKILVFLIRPTTWILLLLLLAFFARGPRWRRRFLVAGLLFFLFFGNRWLSNAVIGWWEEETLTAEAVQAPYDLGILLGGYSNRNIQPGQDRVNFSERANRFLNAIELYRSGKFERLLLTGGSAALRPDGSATEATRSAAFLEAFGVPDSALIVEARSRNTRENALYSRQVLDGMQPGTRCLLLTSAWHMPRASACFRKVGLAVTPFSVDHLYEAPGQGLDWWLLPQWKAFYIWEILIKEWVGYLAYRLNGYI